MDNLAPAPNSADNRIIAYKNDLAVLSIVASYGHLRRSEIVEWQRCFIMSSKQLPWLRAFLNQEQLPRDPSPDARATITRINLGALQHLPASDPSAYLPAGY